MALIVYAGSTVQSLMATYTSHSLLLIVISELSTAAGEVGSKKPEVSSLDPVEIGNLW